MEPAKIDWKNIDSRFVEDEHYEHINAPQWFDFLDPLEPSVDDEAWFCRPDCHHPKIAQDFISSSPSKLHSTADVSDITPLGDKTQREAKLKRRGLTQFWNSKFNEDSEDKNPNLYSSTLAKNFTKSSSQKMVEENEREGVEESKDVLSRMKRTVSARNLFAGRDVLNQITDFCSELKRLATRARERDNAEKNMEKSIKEEEVLGDKDLRKRERKPLLEVKVVKEISPSQGIQQSNSNSNSNSSKEEEVLGDKDLRKRERKPLLEVKVVKEISPSQGIPQSNSNSSKEKQIRRKTRIDEAENVHISVNLENNVKRKGGKNSLLQIRTNPPSPQCFSATRIPGKTTPSSKSTMITMESGILKEQNTKVLVKSEKEGKSPITTTTSSSLLISDIGKQARALDVFWFLKPCTL